MAYRVTLTRRDTAAPDPERSSSFEVETDTEAARVVQEGAAIAEEQGRSVTYEVHDAGGRLVMLQSSTGHGTGPTGPG